MLTPASAAISLNDRSGITRRQEILELERLIVRRAAPEQIDNPVARDPEEPRCDVVDRHQPPVGLDQPREDVLKDVFRIPGIEHASPDEAQQPGLLPGDHLGEPVVVLRHLTMKT
jgi:hypothetical protein